MGWFSSDDDESHQPATAEQKIFARRLGITLPHGCMKWHASDLIDEALELHRQGRQNRNVHAPTNDDDVMIWDIPVTASGKKRKKKGGCFGCLMKLVALLVWAILALIAFGVYQNYHH